MSLGEVFVWELATVDGLTTDTGTVGEVTTLQHEVWDDSVEWAAGVAETFFARAESSEVLSGLWGHVVVQLESDTANWLAVSLDIEENFGHAVEYYYC